ncbi:thermonuclease family protein [Anaerococcus sp.]|uniref:thermonuclease family protein n=1 Tax=Anaerococcus sp. TaxID=1872515 RepID=UPI00280B8B79|nr:thermonuclease family protein [Anaerococcus sp.]
MLLLGFWSSGLSGFLSFGFILTIPWYFRYRRRYKKGLVDSKIYHRGIAALSIAILIAFGKIDAPSNSNTEPLQAVSTEQVEASTDEELEASRLAEEEASRKKEEEERKAKELEEKKAKEEQAAKEKELAEQEAATRRQEELTKAKDDAIEELTGLEYLAANEIVKFTEEIHKQKSPALVFEVLSRANRQNKENEELANKVDPNEYYQVATVMSVTDGDTITVGIYGNNYKLRFIGVDTPETQHPSKGVEFFGKEASDFTTNKLSNSKVWLERDVSETDKYDRLLRYVWLELPEDPENPTYEEVRDKTINGILCRDGYAQASTYPPDVKYSEWFSKMAAEAKDKGVGLWNEGERSAWEANNKPVAADSQSNNNQATKQQSNQQAPAGGWVQTTEQITNRGKTYTADTTWGPVKGNRNSMIYHAPGQRDYNKISINNVVWFNNESEAQAAGYRKAQR